MSIKGAIEAENFLQKKNKGPLTFGQLVESHRLCDEISQAELARRLGISRSLLCDIEKGRKLVSPERASQIARCLGYSVNVFVATSLEDQLRRAGLKMRVKVEAA